MFDVTPPSLKVVVVDDTAEILELIDAILVDEGFLVVSCQDGGAAVETVATEQPALVIADLRMPGYEQWELVDTLLSDPRTRDTPVIVCSGAVSELQAQRTRLQSRGGDVLMKPFDVAALVTKVRQVTGSA
jgi:twitching motility two-component system response regulator PilH